MDQSLYLKDEITQLFKVSPWYSGDSLQTLRMKITGDFKHEEKKEQIAKSHYYAVNVPYTETFTRKKYKPGNDVLSHTIQILGVLSALGGEYETTSDNGDGTETVTAHKSRKESRVFDYVATQFMQNLYISLNAVASINNQNFVFDFHDELKNLSIEHHNNLPDIGLMPEAAKLLSEREFISQKLEKLKPKMLAKLRDQWREQFCRVSSDSKNPLDFAEVVLRCVNAEFVPSPEFVEDWFLKNLGLKTTDARKQMQIGFIK